MRSVVRHVRRAAWLPGSEGLSDAQLLGAFTAHGEDAAFEALLRRHGPMVLGVCRRVLRDLHHAEDACQATFLVLLRKAGSVKTQTSLGGWLYRVAYRTAMKARAMHTQRQFREKGAAVTASSEVPDEAARQELLEHLDEELNRLPEKYRVPIVLCELEGKSRKRAAGLLGVPEGTLSWRLAQGRKLLARRLARYAGALSVVSLADLAAADLPAPLQGATLAAARRLVAGQALAGLVSAEVLVLTEGVLRAMFLTKLKLVSAVALFVLVGGASLTYGVGEAEPKRPAAQGRVLDEIEALRLEVEALRKGLQVTRDRVKALEDEVHTLQRRGPAQLGNGPGAGGGGFIGAPPAGSAGSGGFIGAPPGTGPGSQGLGIPVWTGPLLHSEGATADPVAQAESALSRLRQHPGDKPATDLLGQALQELKERHASTPASYVAESALRRFRANPGDKQAADRLEQALKKLEQVVQKVKERNKEQNIDSAAPYFVEHALKKFRENPGDGQAADNLEHWLKHLADRDLDERTWRRPAEPSVK